MNKKIIITSIVFLLLCVASFLIFIDVQSLNRETKVYAILIDHSDEFTKYQSDVVKAEIFSFLDEIANRSENYNYHILTNTVSSNLAASEDFTNFKIEKKTGEPLKYLNARVEAIKKQFSKFLDASLSPSETSETDLFDMINKIAIKSSNISKKSEVVLIIVSDMLHFYQGDSRFSINSSYISNLSKFAQDIEESNTLKGFKIKVLLIDRRNYPQYSQIYSDRGKKLLQVWSNYFKSQGVTEEDSKNILSTFVTHKR